MTNSDDDQQQHLRELLEIHTRNARSLEKQIAQFGIEPPLKLINSLDYEQRAQRAIERALDGFELRRADTSLARRTAARRAGVSRRWWMIASVGIVLIAALLGFTLLRPAPNAVLVDEIRATQPGTRSITVHLADSHAAPPRFDVRAGDVVALFIINDTAQPSRVVLVEGALTDASSALTAGATIAEHGALLAPGEQSAFPFVAVAGRSYTFASAPSGSPVPTFWATIATYNGNGE